MANTRFMIGIIAILMVFIIACAPSQPATPEQKTGKVMEKAAGSGKVVSVAMKGFKFVPADVSVKVGDTVVWTNEDSVPHTVESSDKSFKSDELSHGDTFSFTFTKAGKYDYICGIHQSMHGSVTVQ